MSVNPNETIPSQMRQGNQRQMGQGQYGTEAQMPRYGHHEGEGEWSGSRMGLYSAIAAGSIGALAYMLMSSKGRGIAEESWEHFGERARRSLRGPESSQIEVREIMTDSPAVCTPDTSLKQVTEMMVECDCGAIPVVESRSSRRAVGIITDRDIVVRCLAKGKNPMDATVRDCMTQQVYSVHPDQTVEEVCELMEDKQVRRVIVVDRNNKVRGIVAQADVAMYAPRREAAQVIRRVSQPSSSLVGSWSR